MITTVLVFHPTYHLFTLQTLLALIYLNSLYKCLFFLPFLNMLPSSHSLNIFHAIVISPKSLQDHVYSFSSSIACIYGKFFKLIYTPINKKNTYHLSCNSQSIKFYTPQLPPLQELLHFHTTSSSKWSLTLLLLSLCCHMYQFFIAFFCVFGWF